MEYRHPNRRLYKVLLGDGGVKENGGFDKILGERFLNILN